MTSCLTRLSIIPRDPRMLLCLGFNYRERCLAMDTDYSQLIGKTKASID